MKIRFLYFSLRVILLVPILGDALLHHCELNFDAGFSYHKVEPNQEFQGLVCEGANVLPSKFLEDAFRDGYGRFSKLWFVFSIAD